MNRKRFVDCCSLVLLLSLPLATYAATPPDFKAVPGKYAGTVAPYFQGTVILSELPQMSPSEKRPVSMPVRYPEGAAAHQAMVDKVLRESAATSALSGQAGPSKGGFIPFTPNATRLFTGLTESCSNRTPSDMGIAVSSSWLVQVINSCIVVMDKNQGIVQPGFPKSLDTFFGHPGFFIFDPRLTFDWVKNRFILVAASFQGNPASGTLFVAASQTADPRGAWNIFAFCYDGCNGDFPDFPTLGFDNSAIYIGTNNFTAAGGFTNELWILTKSAVYAGPPAAPVVNVFTGFSICFATCALFDTLQPANVSMKSDQTTRVEYVVSSVNGALAASLGCGSPSTPCNGLYIWEITRPLAATPDFFLEFVKTPSSYTFPTPATQPGCTTNTTGCMIDTGDMRISGNVQYAHGSLYPSIETSIGGGENSILTWEVRPARNQPRVLDEISYFFGGLRCTGSALFGTAQPDPAGNLTMGFGFTSTCDNPGFAYVSRRVSAPPFASWPDGGFFLAQGATVYTGGPVTTAVACNAGATTPEPLWIWAAPSRRGCGSVAC